VTLRTNRITRRAASAALVGLTAKAGPKLNGGFVFESHVAGHTLRDKTMQASPRERRKVPVLIVGGGIAGLSAGWWLHRNGFRDFLILEMEEAVGGNSRSGENEISAYPLAAHYVPVPNRESTLVRELFEELGLLTDGVWAERWLCHSPQERLFLHGRWQEGVEPELGLTAADRREFQSFAARITELRATKQFTIPVGAGAPRRSELDAIDFRSWLLANGYKSPYLHWLADYSTRDDYGAASADTSAWAGLHYFASREHDEKAPLTWPEGNGWIVKRLASQLAPHLRPAEPAVHIASEKTRWMVTTRLARYEAEHVIYAAPTFLLPYLDSSFPPQPALEYSPWLVANLTLSRMPAEKGYPLCWDNVIYKSPSLGYVNATHQSVSSRIDRSVWTYYLALSHARPAEARRELLATGWEKWTQRILADLSQPHPDIAQCVSRIDIFRIGHAMARPTPGFLSRIGAAQGPLRPRFYLANSDRSSLSLFEEAQHNGVAAARRVLGT
jgi:glycine/D-amino acid oxidase-like deaminating enzyme